MNRLTDRMLARLGSDFTRFSDERGSGARVEFPGIGFLRVIDARTTRSASPREKGWVICSDNPDGSPSHANYYPSFVQAVRALDENAVVGS